jgi:hypothetical protein
MACESGHVRLSTRSPLSGPGLTLPGVQRDTKTSMVMLTMVVFIGIVAAFMPPRYPQDGGHQVVSCVRDKSDPKPTLIVKADPLGDQGRAREYRMRGCEWPGH